MDEWNANPAFWIFSTRKYYSRRHSWNPVFALQVNAQRCWTDTESEIRGLLNAHEVVVRSSVALVYTELTSKCFSDRCQNRLPQRSTVSLLAETSNTSARNWDSPSFCPQEASLHREGHTSVDNCLFSLILRRADISCVGPLHGLLNWGVKW